MNTRDTRLLVIGGGPGGYVAAIRAAQLGVPTVLVDAGGLGGTCLNVGCIPSKALIHVADAYADVVAAATGEGTPLGIRAGTPSLDLATSQRWIGGVVRRLTGGVGALLDRTGVEVVRGTAAIVDGKTVEVADAEDGAVRLRCEHLVLATGSEPVELPQLPFQGRGGRVVDSTGALGFETVPEQLVVVGAGYIGLELGIAWRKLGAKVAVVEAAQQVLPAWDEELAKPVQASLRRLGIGLHLACTAEGPTAAGDGLRVRSAQADEFALPAERILVAAGRRPRTAGFGLESLRLAMQGRAVQVDAQCRTSMRGVFAIGDLTGEPMLAHRAMAHGAMVAEIVAGQARRFEPLAIPAVCFTDPEVVVAGLQPSDAAASGLDCTVASFPFKANGRALTMEASDGFVRVVARRADQRIVGWAAVGRGVSELASTFAQSIESGSLLEDVAGTIHAHPTLGEAVQEAALKALGRALHA